MSDAAFWRRSSTKKFSSLRLHRANQRGSAPSRPRSGKCTRAGACLRPDGRSRRVLSKPLKARIMPVTFWLRPRLGERRRMPSARAGYCSDAPRRLRERSLRHFSRLGNCLRIGAGKARERSLSRPEAPRKLSLTLDGDIRAHSSPGLRECNCRRRRLHRPRRNMTFSAICSRHSHLANVKSPNLCFAATRIALSRPSYRSLNIRLKVTCLRSLTDWVCGRAGSSWISCATSIRRGSQA